MVAPRGSHAAHAQRVACVCITTELLGNHAFRTIRRLDHDGCGTIAKEHCDIAVRPVHERADTFHADDDGVSDDAGADHGSRAGQSVEKTRARRVDVHRGGILRAQQPLHGGRGVGNVFVGGDRAQHDQIDIGSIESGAGKSAGRSDMRQHRHRHMRYAPFPDAGTAGDPFVRGVEEGCEPGVVEHGRRHALAPAGNRCVCHKRYATTGGPNCVRSIA